MLYFSTRVTAVHIFKAIRFFITRLFIYERSVTNILDWSLAYSFIYQEYVWIDLFNNTGWPIFLAQSPVVGRARIMANGNSDANVHTLSTIFNELREFIFCFIYYYFLPCLYCGININLLASNLHCFFPEQVMALYSSWN